VPVSNQTIVEMMEVPPPPDDFPTGSVRWFCGLSPILNGQESTLQKATHNWQ